MDTKWITRICVLLGVAMLGVAGLTLSQDARTSAKQREKEQAALALKASEQVKNEAESKKLRSAILQDKKNAEAARKAGRKYKRRFLMASIKVSGTSDPTFPDLNSTYFPGDGSGFLPDGNSWSANDYLSDGVDPSTGVPYSTYHSCLIRKVGGVWHLQTFNSISYDDYAVSSGDQSGDPSKATWPSGIVVSSSAPAPPKITDIKDIGAIAHNVETWDPSWYALGLTVSGTEDHEATLIFEESDTTHPLPLVAYNAATMYRWVVFSEEGQTDVMSDYTHILTCPLCPVARLDGVGYWDITAPETRPVEGSVLNLQTNWWDGAFHDDEFQNLESDVADGQVIRFAERVPKGTMLRWQYEYPEDFGGEGGSDTSSTSNELLGKWPGKVTAGFHDF